MVEAWQERVVASSPDQALQPPVGRVQRVGVGAAARHQAGIAKAAKKLVGPVDPDVPSRVVVVLLGEGPANPFGAAARYRDRRLASGTHDALDLSDRGAVVGDVLEDLA